MTPYISTLGVVAGFLITATLFGIRGDRRRRRLFLGKMRRIYGKYPDKNYTHENFLHIPTLFRHHEKEDSVDDITWNDLDMDGVFMRLNYCRSAAGEEMLYHCLRNPACMGDGIAADEELFEKKVDFYDKETEQRLQAQLLFDEMRQVSKFSVYDHMEAMENTLDTNNTGHFIILGLLAAAIVGCFFNFKVYILAVVLLLIANVINYFREKSKNQAYYATFSYILRLLQGSKKISALLRKAGDGTLFAKEVEGMEQSIAAMAAFQRGSSLVMKASLGSSGNPLDLILDYLKMLTHADLIKFNQMYRHLQNHWEDVDRLIMSSGAAEVPLSVACYRASVRQSYCHPEFTEENVLDLKEIFHPLIEKPVPNSLRCEKNILLTGSNASGKSTFLKTTAIGAIMAQSIRTVCGEGYRAPVYRIYSSMALSDNLQEGESYYIVEIKSLKRILEATKKEGPRVLCFVDEVLRGTNTVERIAASAQILKHFARQDMLCFAATHDGELTGMLGNNYDNYHFDGKISGDDVRFDYRLHNGSASTRNAIQLLKMLGYDASIVTAAEQSAAQFLKSGVWKAI